MEVQYCPDLRTQQGPINHKLPRDRRRCYWQTAECPEKDHSDGRRAGAHHLKMRSQMGGCNCSFQLIRERLQSHMFLWGAMPSDMRQWSQTVTTRRGKGCSQEELGSTVIRCPARLWSIRSWRFIIICLDEALGNMLCLRHWPYFEQGGYIDSLLYCYCWFLGTIAGYTTGPAIRLDF